MDGDLLAQTSLELLFQVPKTKCKNMKLQTTNSRLYDAMVKAIDYMAQLASGILEDSGGLFEDDFDKLRLLHLKSSSCKLSSGHTTQRTCQWAPASKEIAIRYRMSVKLLLEQGITFLSSMCPSVVDIEHLIQPSWAIS